MKWMSLLWVLLVVLEVGITPVCAGPYFSGNLGVGFVNDVDVSDGVEKYELSFDPGFGLSAAFGNTYPNNFRAELELGYFKSDLDKVTLVGVGSEDLGGDGQLMTLMFNSYYDFIPEAMFSPFVGLGIGYANAELDLLGISEDDDVLAYQAIAGGAFNLSKQLMLDLQYRFFDTEDLEFEAGIEADSVRTHSLLIGLRYGF